MLFFVPLTLFFFSLFRFVSFHFENEKKQTMKNNWLFPIGFAINISELIESQINPKIYWACHTQYAQHVGLLFSKNALFHFITLQSRKKRRAIDSHGMLSILCSVVFCALDRLYFFSLRWLRSTNRRTGDAQINQIYNTENDANELRTSENCLIKVDVK